MSVEAALLATEAKSKQYFNLIGEDWMLVYWNWLNYQILSTIWDVMAHITYIEKQGSGNIFHYFV